MTEWNAALAKSTVRDAMVGRGSPRPWGAFELVEVTSTMTLRQTIEKLKRHHIQSCPVRNVNSGEFTSFVSVDDLAMMQMFLGNSREWLELLAREEIPLDDFAKRVEEEFATIEVGDVSNAGEKNPWVTIAASSPLQAAIEAMTKTQSLHRLAVTDVIDGNEKVVGLVTQIGVLSYLATLLDTHNDVASGSIASSLPTAREVISCNLTTTALEAMTKLVEAKVSGIAVLDDDGKLADVLSASDVLTVNSEDTFKKLYKPVSEFIHRDDGFEPAAVTGSDKLADAIRTLLARKIHRLFVLEDGKPVNVVAVGDVLKALASA